MVLPNYQNVLTKLTYPSYKSGIAISRACNKLKTIYFKNIHIGSIILQRVNECNIENTRICNFLKCDEIDLKKMYSSESLDLNNKIFGYKSKIDRKHYAYLKSDIIEILNFQKKHCLNDVQLAKHFKISRNSIANWKKIFTHT